MPNNMDFFDFLSQHSLEDVLSAIIQYQLENLMHDGEQLSLAEYGKEFLSSSSQKIKLKNTSSKYVVCVTAEHFGNVPSETTFYNLIDSQAHLRPYIVNIFDLDIITQECSSIEDFLSYLDFRAQHIPL